MRAKVNWNLFVSLWGAKRKISPANVNQVSNIVLETSVRFLAIIVLRIAYVVGFLRYTHHTQSPDELFPSVLAVVHSVFPQFQVFQVHAGPTGYGTEGVLHPFDFQAGCICQHCIHTSQQ